MSKALDKLTPNGYRKSVDERIKYRREVRRRRMLGNGFWGLSVLSTLRRSDGLRFYLELCERVGFDLK